MGEIPVKGNDTSKSSNIKYTLKDPPSSQGKEGRRGKGNEFVSFLLPLMLFAH